MNPRPFAFMKAMTAAADPGWQMIQTAHGSTTAGANGYYDSESYVVGASGYATQFQIWVVVAAGGNNMKVALYNSAEALIAQSAAMAVTATGYAIFTYTASAAITSGQTYRPAWTPDGPNLSWGYNAVAGPTSAEFRPLAYASFPEATRIAGTPFTTANYDAGIFVSATP